MKSFKKPKLTYPKIVAAGYFTLIAAGTLLLLLPFASRDNTSVGFLSALFTSTASSCVTGLTLFDTYSQWSLFGQIVILALIQIGGLGFMTILAFFSMFLKRRIGLSERILLRDSINTMYIGGIVDLTKKIVFGTVLFEGAGAIILACRFVPRMGLFKGAYTGLFMSISAFCNAGVDLMGQFEPNSSLSTLSHDPVALLTMAILMVVGGIGFFVWGDLSEHKWHWKKYQLHTKVVLSVTGILIAAGTAVIFLVEYHHAYADLNMLETFTAALFGSVSPRTSGFYVVEFSEFQPASKLLTYLYMFIGGSPGSTSGGIKTTTFAVILIAAWASLRNKNGLNIFKRRLEPDALSRATTIITIYAVIIGASSFAIGLLQPEFSFSAIVFETFSSTMTVGITQGITPQLAPVSKLIVILLMYAGRTGSLAFAMLFTEKSRKETIQRPLGHINIG